MVKNLPAVEETWVQSLGLGRSPGGGNGHRLQYSYLENPMDRGAWGATVHGVPIYIYIYIFFFWVLLLMCVCVCVQSLSSVWLCDPIDCSPPGSSVQGIHHARILGQVAQYSFLQEIFPTKGSNLSLLHCSWIFTTEQLGESLFLFIGNYKILSIVPCAI